MTLADAIIQEDLSLVRQCLAMGAPINEEDEYGFTPLIESAIVNNLPLSQLLLEAGADPNGQDATGQTALHWAVENSNGALVTLLLAKGANPNRYTLAGQAPLVKAILRDASEIKKTLLEHGADSTFARDYLNTKILGHRFELMGRVDVVDSEGLFTEVDYEGFYLEFTLGMIRQSLLDYRRNYAAKRLQSYFPTIEPILDALACSHELIRLQQYNVDREACKQQILDLLHQPGLQIIPIAHEGHAVTLVYYQHHLVICDRRQDAQLVDTMGVYRVTHPQQWNATLLHTLLYQVKPKDFVNVRLPALLGLKLHTRLLMPAQITGNCSWANVEAAVPAAYYLLTMERDRIPGEVVARDHPAMLFFHQWREWDKARELDFCLQTVSEANPARKASKLATLAAILFQRCGSHHPEDVRRAKKIVSVLQDDDYDYILQSYREIYLRWKKTPAGKNLSALLAAVKEEY